MLEQVIVIFQKIITKLGENLKTLYYFWSVRVKEHEEAVADKPGCISKGSLTALIWIFTCLILIPELYIIIIVEISLTKINIERANIVLGYDSICVQHETARYESDNIIIHVISKMQRALLPPL